MLKHLESGRNVLELLIDLIRKCMPPGRELCLQFFLGALMGNDLNLDVLEIDVTLSFCLRTADEERPFQSLCKLKKLT